MGQPLTIVADAHIWGVESAFAELPRFDVDLRIVENRDINPEAVRDADILLIRSSTKVDAGLLKGSKVRFAATATIGDDHFDKKWLTSQGIAFANAAGSSTGSVIEYLIAVLLDLHVHGLINIPETRIGIIGAGRIGGGFENICRKLGMDVLVNDPPRARAEGSKGFATLDELLAHADVISLHTPLTHDGEDVTWHLISANELERFRGHGVINAGRGGCLDNHALVRWLNSSKEHFAVLDCWENEPNISRELLAHDQVTLATPHIAGHSLDGKAANTQFVYNALCEWLDVPPRWDMHMHLPEPAKKIIEIKTHDDPWHTLSHTVSKLYDIREDNRRFGDILKPGDDAMAQAFIDLRRHYPVRRAWNLYSIRFEPAREDAAGLAAALGLQIM